MSRIKKLVRRIRKGQFKYIAGYALRRVFPIPNKIFYWDTFVMMVARQLERDVRTRDDNGYVVREIYTAYDTWRLLDQYPQHAAFNNPRISDPEAKCFVVEQGDTIVGYGWLKGLNRVETNAGYIATFQDTKPSWGYGFYIHPNYRKTTVFMRMARALKELCEEAGFNALYSETHVMNLPAIVSFARVGMHVYETVTVASLFGLKLYFVRDKKTNKLRVTFRYTNNTHSILSVEGTPA